MRTPLGDQSLILSSSSRGAEEAMTETRETFEVAEE